MSHRLLTTWLPLLALAVALALVGHDAAMAGGPHDPAGAHGAHHGDHDPAGETACGELVAARTTDAMPGVDAAAGPGEAVAIDPIAGFGTGDARGGPGDPPPAPSRAALQIWLN